MDAPDSNRRSFIKEAAAVVVGAIVTVIPALAGLLVLLDPLRRHQDSSRKIRVTTLEAVPEDGIPRKFPILADRKDAWNRFPEVPIGAVYLRRTGKTTVEALNVVCPHAGCFVDFRSETKSYFCPCHNSSFSVNGKIADPKSPSPRGMDGLEVEVKDGGEIWVRFQNFRTGQVEKVPVG